MSSSRPIALAGLSPSEQALLEGALFLPGINQIPGIHQVHDLTQAKLVIANADDVTAVRVLQASALSGQVLLLGASDAGTGWTVVSRPLRLQAVLEAARRLLGPLEPAQFEPEPDDDDDETEPAPRPGGWLRRGQPEPQAFAATQPFIPAGVQDLKGVLGLGTIGHQYEATQPFLGGQGSLLKSAAAKAAAAAAAMPAHPPVQFQSTQPFTGVHDGNYHPAQQLDLEVPSVAPSYWEAEVAEWEAQQTGGRLPLTLPGRSVPAATPSPPPPVTPSKPAEAPSSFSRAAVPTASRETHDRILIIGQSGPAAGGLLKILQFAGFTTDLVPDGGHAMQYLALQPYRFVFLIEVSLGADVIALCSAIRRNPGLAIKPPYLVIVSFRRNLSARLRAWMAGCHTWMSIPLNKTLLLDYLGRHASPH